MIVATGDSKSDLHQWERANKLLEGLPAGSSSSSEFFLWREGEVHQRIAHEHPSVAITEVWNKPSRSLLRRSRHFDANQRAIEFEPFSIAPREPTNKAQTVASSAQPGMDIWLQKYHLAYELPEPATPFLHPDGYTKLLKQGLLAGVEKSLLSEFVNKQACGELKVIHDLRKRFSSEVVWDESTKLPLYMQSVRDNSAPLDFTQPKSEQNSVGALSVISRWVLISLETDKQEIGERFSEWDSYETTDFSDIGDNESDPFLMRMINLGFISHGASGFYDAAGNVLSSGIGHYHPPVSGTRRNQ